MSKTNEDDVMSTLSYLRGENSVPTSNVTGRKDFIQRTLEEVYQAHPWRFAKRLATVSVDASGIASLPSGLTFDHDVNITYYEGSDEITLEEINVADRNKAQGGDRVYWVLPQDTNDENYNFYTKESVTSVDIEYQVLPPDINATIGTPFRDRLVLALGANRWVKMSEDPQADVSQDDVLFRNQLQKSIAGESRNFAKRQLRTAQTESGHHTGDF